MSYNLETTRENLEPEKKPIVIDGFPVNPDLVYAYTHIRNYYGPALARTAFLTWKEITSDLPDSTIENLEPENKTLFIDGHEIECDRIDLYNKIKSRVRPENAWLSFESWKEITDEIGLYRVAKDSDPFDYEISDSEEQVKTRAILNRQWMSVVPRGGWTRAKQRMQGLISISENDEKLDVEDGRRDIILAFPEITPQLERSLDAQTEDESYMSSNDSDQSIEATTEFDDGVGGDQSSRLPKGLSSKTIERLTALGQAIEYHNKNLVGKVLTRVDMVLLPEMSPGDSLDNTEALLLNEIAKSKTVEEPLTTILKIVSAPEGRKPIEIDVPLNHVVKKIPEIQADGYKPSLHQNVEEERYSGSNIVVNWYK
jgi:hypothetical protein